MSICRKTNVSRVNPDTSRFYNGMNPQNEFFTPGLLSLSETPGCGAQVAGVQLWLAMHYRLEFVPPEAKIFRGDRRIFRGYVSATV